MMRQADNLSGPLIEIGFGIQIENVWKFLIKENIA
jgi:hypothetical protein